MMLVSLISYIDRNALALLAPTILSDTRLSNEQYGWIVSGFSIAYMVGNPVWGVLLDRYGLRTGMTVAVACWSVASASHAVAAGLWSFVAARVLLGFGEGATFPGGLRTATETLPPALRSRGIALAYSGGSLGAVLTPLIITPVGLRWGWRGAFVFTGLIGLAWLVLWAFTSRRVTKSRAGVKAHRETWVKIRPGHPGIWGFIALYALGALPLAFVIYGAALYLGRVRGVTQAELGTLLWIPPLGWEVGYFFWGWISDRFGPIADMKARFIFGVLTVLSLPLAVAPGISSVVLLMIAMFFAMFIAAGFVILSIAYATEIFGTGSSGLIAGTGAGSWSAVVALFMPVVGRLFDAGLYNAAFVLASAVPLMGFAGWFVADALLQNRAAPPADVV